MVRLRQRIWEELGQEKGRMFVEAEAEVSGQQVVITEDGSTVEGNETRMEDDRREVEVVEERMESAASKATDKEVEKVRKVKRVSKERTVDEKEIKERERVREREREEEEREFRRNRA